MFSCRIAQGFAGSGTYRITRIARTGSVRAGSAEGDKADRQPRTPLAQESRNRSTAKNAAVIGRRLRQVEFCEDAGDVLFHCAFGDRKLARDRRIGTSQRSAHEEPELRPGPLDER